MLPRERRKVATLDWDSPIHDVCGQKKEGADFAYDNTWSYSALYGTLAETGEFVSCGKAGHEPGDQGSSAGTLNGSSQSLSAGADARRQPTTAKSLVTICEQPEVEFFIVAKLYRT